MSEGNWLPDPCGAATGGVEYSFPTNKKAANFV